MHIRIILLMLLISQMSLEVWGQCIAEKKMQPAQARGKMYSKEIATDSSYCPKYPVSCRYQGLNSKLDTIGTAKFERSKGKLPVPADHYVNTTIAKADTTEKITA